MTLKKLLFTIAGVAAVVGAVLPWVRVSLFGISVTSTAFEMGGLYLVLAIIAIVCGVVAVLLNVFKEKQIKKIIKINLPEKMPLFIGIALLAIAVIAFIAVKNESKGYGSASFGIWLIGLAGVVTGVLTFLKQKELDKVVFGQAEKAEKTEKVEKPAKKEAKKTTKK